MEGLCTRALLSHANTVECGGRHHPRTQQAVFELVPICYIHTNSRVYINVIVEMENKISRKIVRSPQNKRWQLDLIGTLHAAYFQLKMLTNRSHMIKY